MTGYEQFRDETFSESDLTALTTLAADLNAAELEAAQIETKLKAARARVADLAERQIPELMDTLGMKTFTTKTGFRVEVKRTLRASVPAARKFEAYKWLDDHGHSGLIKRSILVAFDKAQTAEAQALAKKLGAEFENVKTDLKVEPSTLRAFIAEQLKRGENIPLDLFGAWEQRVAKISLTK